jgi:hypothetical protein
MENQTVGMTSKKNTYKVRLKIRPCFRGTKHEKERRTRAERPEPISGASPVTRKGQG